MTDATNNEDDEFAGIVLLRERAIGVVGFILITAATELDSR